MAKPSVFMRVLSYDCRGSTRQSKRIIEWIQSGRYDIDFDYGEHLIPTDSARNTLIKEFLSGRCDYFFCMDDDVIPGAVPDMLETLLEADKDLIAPVIFAIKKNQLFKVAAPRPLVHKLDANGEWFVALKADQRDLSPIEVDLLPGGCHLIKRKVLEVLPRPYYKYTYDPDGVISQMSDEYFSRLAQEHGFSLYVHPLVGCEQLESVGTMSFNMTIMNSITRAIQTYQKQKVFEDRRKKLVGLP